MPKFFAERLCVKLHLRDGRTDGQTDAGNRIWCICDIWWQ